MPEPVSTTCPYCGVGCGVLVEPDDAGGMRVRGDPAHPANFGKLCSKGAALGETIDLDGRLLAPTVHGQVVDWGLALDRVADGLRAVIDRHGPDAVAFYVSGQLLTEDYYVANKLMKGFIGSANIDTNSRLCMSSSVVGHKRAFGADAVPGCYEDLEQADLVVLTGSNAAWCHPVLYQRLVMAKRQRPDMRVVVIDPRRTATCDIADLHLAVNPGTDSMLFSGLLVELDRAGCTDQSFVQQHTQGLQEALHSARWYTPSTAVVAEFCGLDITALTDFYHWFVATNKVVTVYSQGINQTSSGSDKVNAIINCHLLTGRIGRPGMGPLSFTGQPNAMGGREVGALSNQLAAHMDLHEEEHIATVSRFWQSQRVARTPGLKAVDLFRAVERGEIKAIWIMATNPVVSMPDADQVLRALKRCDLVIASDCMAATDTTQLAHICLPAEAWGEKDGTVTNSERRISRQRRFLPSAGSARPDWWIIAQVAQRLGFAGFAYPDASAVFREHAALSGFENHGERDFDISALAEISPAGYAGLQPLQWPVRAGCPQGTPRLFGDGRFFTPSARARLIPITPRPPLNRCDQDYPIVLNTGRVRDHWHTMTRTGKSPRLSAHVMEPYVDIHPRDARGNGITDGGLAKVSSRWGEAIVRARLSTHQQPGQVFVPMHWSGQYAATGRIGAVVNPVVDPESGQPEFKHTPVRIAPYRAKWYGFLLSRCQTLPNTATYWSKAKRYGLWHYELAGEQTPADWAACARGLMGSDAGQVQWGEMWDKAENRYRAAGFVDGRLDSCIFIGPDSTLPTRDWLVGLFKQDRLDATERARVLSGIAPASAEDAGPVICSCFGVGRNTLVKAIRTQGLTTPEDIGKVLNAGTNCGSCVPELRILIAETNAPGKSP